MVFEIVIGYLFDFYGSLSLFDSAYIRHFFSNFSFSNEMTHNIILMRMEKMA